MYSKPLAVVLAGGESKRMQGRDKPLQPLHGRPLIAHVLETIQPCVGDTVISVNHNDQDYRQFGLPCVADIPVLKSSPLVGIVSSMHWYRQQGHSDGQLLVVPADVPYFPRQIVSLLQQSLAQDGVRCACIEADGRLQPLFSLWSLSLATPVLREVSRGNLGVIYVLEKYRAKRVAVASINPNDFVNVNTGAQLAELEAKSDQ